jgi:hypothetical protein
MTEFILNLAWIGLGAAAYCAFRRFAATGRPREAAALVALACVMILIFPAISASDDLYGAEYAMDEGLSASKHFRSLDSSRPSHTMVASEPPLPAFFCGAALDSVLFELPTGGVKADPRHRTAPLDRAPPATPSTLFQS